MPMMEPPTQKEPTSVRPRMSYACEACRSAKVKCQSSNQQGICRRCSESKRECVFKTGPRTRRPRLLKSSSSTSPTSTLKQAPPFIAPPPGPSKTFTLDIPMPADEVELSNNLEALRVNHEMFIDNLARGDDLSSTPSSPTPQSDDEHSEKFNFNQVRSSSSVVSHASSLPVGASAFSTPPSSATGNSSWSKKRSGLASLGVRPQFNLDSAEKLLAQFERGMLVHFPAVDLKSMMDEEAEEPSVTALAKRNPFVLLAILAAASGSRTLQGHSLYDEEFRKILGLKFVAGGERSLELLVGLVVYTAWYPFHLRPKNKQAFQYIRMAVDIVNDLELDQDPDPDNHNHTTITPTRLTEIRAYLSTYYLVSSSSTSWCRPPSMAYTPYTSKATDMLLSHPLASAGDKTLSWLVRLQHITEEITSLIQSSPGTGPQNDYQLSLMLKGMESHLAEWEHVRMGPEIASTPSVRLALLFTRIHINAAPLVPTPLAKKAQRSPTPPLHRPDVGRLESVIPRIREVFEFILTLRKGELNSFSGTDWARYIIVIILAFKLSFPVEGLAEWRDGWARGEIGLGGFLERLGGIGGEREEREEGGGVASSVAGVDVLSASQVVLELVKRKWEKRAGRMDRREERRQEQQKCPHQPGVNVAELEPMGLDRSMQGCPMMDGSVDSYVSLWDESFVAEAGSSNMFSGIGGEEQMTEMPPLDAYPDLWGSMTTDWAEQWPQPGFGISESYGQ